MALVVEGNPHDSCSNKASSIQAVKECSSNRKGVPALPDAPQPLCRALWSLSEGIWGILGVVGGAGYYYDLRNMP